MDTELLMLIIQVLGSVLSPIVLYYAFKRGAEKTIDIAIEKLEKKYEVSPTAQRLAKLLETSDQLFGDDQLVQNVTKFFKEAGEWVSSPEAKNVFKNINKLLKKLTENQNEKTRMPPPKKEEQS
jgi:hypothetical protein